MYMCWFCYLYNDNNLYHRKKLQFIKPYQTKWSNFKKCWNGSLTLIKLLKLSYCYSLIFAPYIKPKGKTHLKKTNITSLWRCLSGAVSVYESIWEGVPWRLTLHTYWLIYIRPFLKYDYGRWWCDKI